MRLFTIILLFSTQAFAQLDVGNGSIPNCTQADLVNGGPIECGQLIISTTPSFVASSPAVDVRVTGNVFINAALILSGSDAPDADTGTAKGLGGPGAGDGGSANFGAPSAGDGSSGGGPGVNDGGGICGGGGGGGGFVLAGAAGIACTTQAGGYAGPVYSSPFSGVLRGGFGGGAGGDMGSTIGPGGGGGGAIRIRAGGNITINGNIVSNGGNGGNALSAGGGGGGGSGGLIWIQALGNISNTATMSTNGGLGGASTSSGNGSSGGRGAIRIETITGTITNTGSLPGYTQIQTLPSLGSGDNLNSSISCGMIKPKNDSAIFQIFAGFMLVMILKFFTKTKTHS